MHLTPKIQKAINVSAAKHLGQMRKSSVLPYIVHPFSVAWILAEYTEDEDIIAAGLLHDILEDVKGYYFSDMERDFGPRVAGIVKDVSEEKDPNVKSNLRASWKTRKEKYIIHLRDSSPEALMVAAADKIHNLRSLSEDFRINGEKLWEQFRAGKESTLWFYGEVAEIISQKMPDHPMAELLLKTFNEFKSLV